MDTLKHRLKPGLENALPPGEYRDKLIGLFVERMMTRADTGKLADAAVQIYDKFLSEEDIKAFVQFYSTPLGQKSLNVLPKIVDEISAEARQWGENLGRQCMLEVLTEHPELAKALEDAQKNAQPK